jgi:predicted metal-binding membrane protein
MRRFSGAVLSSSPVAFLSRRDRVLILICVIVVTVLAWAYLVHIGQQMRSATENEKAMVAMGMAMDKPWAIADFLFTFVMWMVMMVGMMSPAAAPMLLLFAAGQSKRTKGRALAAITMFAMGYVSIWAGFSASAALAQWSLHQAAMLSAAMAASSPRLGAAILIAAGIYQLTSWKDRCLIRCRSPLGFLITNWGDGTLGAVRMGLRHGVYCLGCCWALMCVLFAVGVMNLLWVAGLTGLVLVEKIGPQNGVVTRLGGAALILFGIVMMALRLI